MASVKNRVRLTHHEGVLPFRFVNRYHFPEVLAAKAVVILGAHWNSIHRQPEYERSLRPKGMGLSSGIYNQLIRGDIWMKPLVS